MVSWDTVGVSFAFNLLLIIILLLIAVCLRALYQRRARARSTIKDPPDNDLMNRLLSNTSSSVTGGNSTTGRRPVYSHQDSVFSKPGSIVTKDRRISDYTSQWCTTHKLSEATAQVLRENGFNTPETIAALQADDIKSLPLPNIGQECLLRRALYSQQSVIKTPGSKSHNTSSWSKNTDLGNSSSTPISPFVISTSAMETSPDLTGHSTPFLDRAVDEVDASAIHYQDKFKLKQRSFEILNCDTTWPSQFQGHSSIELASDDDDTTPKLLTYGDYRRPVRSSHPDDDTPPKVFTSTDTSQDKRRNDKKKVSKEHAIDDKKLKKSIPLQLMADNSSGFHGKLSDKGLYDMAGKLGKEWLQLAALLKVPATYIEQLQMDYHSHTRHQIYEMLRKWRDMQMTHTALSKEEIKGHLCNAFDKIDRRDLSDEVLKEHLIGSWDKTPYHSIV